MTTEEYAKRAQYIKAQMQVKGLSQSSVAEAWGYNRSYVCQVLNGVKQSLTVLSLIEKKLKSIESPYEVVEKK